MSWHHMEMLSELLALCDLQIRGNLNVCSAARSGRQQRNRKVLWEDSAGNPRWEADFLTESNSAGSVCKSWRRHEILSWCDHYVCSIGKWVARPKIIVSLITRFMGPTWCLSGAERTQVGPMLAPWTLLSGVTTVYPTRNELWHNVISVQRLVM